MLSMMLKRGRSERRKKATGATIPENIELSGSGIVLEMMAAAASGMSVEERGGHIGVIPWAASLEGTEQQGHHA